MISSLVANSPLDPSPDRAHDLLRRELLRPEYHHESLTQRFMSWLGDQFDAGLDTASQAPPLGILGACVVFLGVVLLLGWLVSRARRDPLTTARPGAVLGEHRLSAAELRRRAESALAAGEPGQALVEGFRALTVRQIERGRLADLPGATAHEVAAALVTTYADRRAAVDGAAALFDLVRYGDRPATPEQARDVLALDDALEASR